jgi:chromosome partitioning protein
MRALTFASIKGGVGKTTLAVHTASALADSGKRTLLMDLDPQGHASLLAGIEVEPDSACVADAFGAAPHYPLQKVIHQTQRPGLWVAPANLRMVAHERDLFRWGHRLDAIPRAMQSLSAPFDALVIDTPPQLNAFTEAALAIADVVAVPVPAMAHALQGLDEIQALWRDVHDGHPSRMVVTVNLWDRRTTATNSAMQDALSGLDVPVTRSRVVRNEALNQAGLAFQVIYDFAPKSEASANLKELSKELWRMSGQIQQQKPMALRKKTT